MTHLAQRMPKAGRRFIPVQEVFEEWDKDPAFRAECDSLEDEFTLAAALIKAEPKRSESIMDGPASAALP